MLRFEENLSQRLGQLPPHLLMDQATLFVKDSNNNSANRDNNNYSLRPRSMRRRTATAVCLIDNDTNNISDPMTQLPEICGKTIVPVKTMRLTASKPKQKAAPLSKYRRKTANARERTRMREINMAFEELRKAVPPHLNSPAPAAVVAATSAANEKLTKITTLRLAMKYISSLSAVLTESSSTSSSTSTSSSSCSVPISELLSDCSDLDSLLLESDGESLPLNSDFSDHSLTPADFTMDFPDDASSLAGVDFSSLSPDLSHHLTHFDPFLSDFS